jgi:hypothetical protein
MFDRGERGIGPRVALGRAKTAGRLTRSMAGEDGGIARRHAVGGASGETEMDIEICSPAKAESASIGSLQRVQIGNDVLERLSFLLGDFGHPMDLLEGRDSADHLQHSIGVKR